MLTSTVMLIYEIVNNKYRVESRTLCCGHNWIWVFAFSRTDHEASCSSIYFALFSNGENLIVEVLRDPQKVSLTCVTFFYLYEIVKPFVFLFWLSWWLCQSSWLLASSYLLSVVLSCLWDGPSDVWLWVDWWSYRGRDVLSVIIRVEIAIHSVRSSYMPSVNPCGWIRDLCSLLGKVVLERAGCLRFLTSEAFCLGFQDFVIFITSKVNFY